MPSFSLRAIAELRGSRAAVSISSAREGFRVADEAAQGEWGGDGASSESAVLLLSPWGRAVPAPFLDRLFFPLVFSGARCRLVSALSVSVVCWLCALSVARSSIN